MNRRLLVGRALVTVGVVGALGAAAGTVTASSLLGSLDQALEDSVEVTATAVDALAATVVVADDAVGEIARTLRDTAVTGRALADAADATVAVLAGAADVTGEEIAGSLAAIDATMPALIDAARVIDRTLSALDALPIGPDYDPEVPFDEALRDVRTELAELPAALRREAALLRTGAQRMGAVAEASTAVTVDLRLLAGTLDELEVVLDEVRGVTDRAAEVLRDGGGDLTTDTGAARVLVVVVGLATMLGQAVPIGAGWLLLRPEALRDLLDPLPDGAPLDAT